MSTDNEELTICVGCYTEVPYAEKEGQHGIYVIRFRKHGFNAPTLELIQKCEQKNITFFVHDAQRRKLYASSEAKAPLSALHRYDVSRFSGGSTPLSNHQKLDLEEPGAAYIGALRSATGGALLAVAFYEGGVVRLVEDVDQTDGSGGTMHRRDAVTFLNHSNVVKERQEAAHPHAAYPLPSGNQFLVPDLGNDAIYHLRITDKSATIERELKMPRGSGPRHVLLHPNKRLLFVVSELSNTLSVYAVDDQFEQITLTAEHSTLGNPESSHKQPNDSLQLCAHLALSSDGRFVLVSNRGRHNSISVFRLVDESGGKLELVGTFSTHGHFPRYFVLLDNNRYLLVANQLSHTLKLYRFENGHVSDVIAELEVPNPAAIVVL